MPEIGERRPALPRAETLESLNECIAPTELANLFSEEIEDEERGGL